MVQCTPGREEDGGAEADALEDIDAVAADNEAASAVPLLTEAIGQRMLRFVDEREKRPQPSN